MYCPTTNINFELLPFEGGGKQGLSSFGRWRRGSLGDPEPLSSWPASGEHSSFIIYISGEDLPFKFKEYDCWCQVCCGSWQYLEVSIQRLQIRRRSIPHSGELLNQHSLINSICWHKLTLHRQIIVTLQYDGAVPGDAGCLRGAPPLHGACCRPIHKVSRCARRITLCRASGRQILILLLAGEDLLERWASCAPCYRVPALAPSSSPSSSAPTTTSSLPGASSTSLPPFRWEKRFNNLHRPKTSPCSRLCLGRPAPTGGTPLDAMHRFWPKHLTEKCCQTKQKS